MIRKMMGAAASVLWLAAARDVQPQSASPTPSAARAVTCAMSNPGYSGWCRQNVDVPAGKSGRAACAAVVACLNNPQCVTKTYCNATTVRGGWRLEKVESAPAAR
jgi:hypothetical protein